MLLPKMNSGPSFAAVAVVLAVLSGLMAHPVGGVQPVMVSIPSGASLAGPPGYSPATVTVVIGVNNTVTWTNSDTAHHTVTPGNEPAGTPWAVGSGDMAPNGVYSFTFMVAGTYTYACAYHNNMAGTVVVKPAVATTPEFPAASLAAILFAVIAAVALAAQRLRPRRIVSPLA